MENFIKSDFIEKLGECWGRCLTENNIKAGFRRTGMSWLSKRIIFFRKNYMCLKLTQYLNVFL